MRGRVRRRDLLRRDFMGFMLNGFMLGSLCVYVGNCSRCGALLLGLHTPKRDCARLSAGRASNGINHFFY